MASSLSLGFSAPCSCACLGDRATSRKAPHAAPALAPAFARPSSSQSSRLHTLRKSAVTPLAAVGESVVGFETVSDVMNSGIMIKCTPSTSVDDALESLSQYNITGMPVVDEDDVVVGVVSDYDLLSLDDIIGKEEDTGFFPDVNTEWNTFAEVQRRILKNAGKFVADVMTPDPLCVRPNTSLSDATRILINMKVRRLPVVDENGRLLGIITRGNIVKGALKARKRARAHN